MEYLYKAFDKEGHKVEGVISAEDLTEAKRRIKESGLIVVEVKEKKSLIRIKGKIKEIDSYRLFSQLHLLLKAGLSLDRALNLYAESIENKEIKSLIDHISRSLKSGKEVHLAFQETGKFSPFIISMIKIGEKTGNLKDIFSNIASYILFNIRFKTEIKNAMMYPSFLILASFIVLLGIFKIIMPRFFSVFAEGVETLPFLAKIFYMISLSINLKNFLLGLFVIVFLIFVLKTKNADLFYSKILDYLMVIPFFKKFVIDFELSKFCYSLHSMLKSGVEFIHALGYSADIIKSNFIKKAIKQTIPMIKEGKSISGVFAEIQFLPPIFKGSLKVAEESGGLADIFFELHQYFDDRFKNSIKRFLTILEPTIITFMGIIIGLIVLSLILTIMSVSNIKL